MSKDLRALFQSESLHRAAQDGDLATVIKLLNQRHPVNRFDELGKTPLHYAVAGEHFEIVDALIDGGANVNAQDERVIGNTPLGDSSGSCSYTMAARLIEAGADPSIPGWMQLTALHRAKERKDDKKVYRLLEQAAKQVRRK